MAYRSEQILRGFDNDVRQHLHEEMSRKGIRIQLQNQVSSLARRTDGKIDVSFSAATPKVESFDSVMYATGRVPSVDGLNLTAAGVETGSSGGIQIDRSCATNVPHIFAVGDVTNGIALTPVAIRQGAAVANSLFGPTSVLADLDWVPSAVFSQPPIGTVGLSETEALEKYNEVDIYQSRFRPLRHALSGREEYTLMKLVVVNSTQQVVGAHMVGPDAPEIVQGLALALRLGATKADFDATMGIHPTSAEEFMTLRDKQTRRKT